MWLFSVKKYRISLLFLALSLSAGAETGENERYIKNLKVKISVRPGFSTLPANSYLYNSVNEFNILPVMLEIPLSQSKLSLRIYPVLGYGTWDERNNWWWWQDTVSHINYNAKPSDIKTYGAEFSLLYYTKKREENRPPNGFYIASNGAAGFHPHYFYQTYKITGEIGWNRLYSKDRLTLGFGLELGETFRHSFRYIFPPLNYTTNQIRLMPKISLGVVL